MSRPYRPTSRAASAALLAAALLAGCARNDERAAAADTPVAADAAPTLPSPAAAASPSAAPANATNPTNAPLTATDVDRWQRGMEAELAAVRDAAARLTGAKTAMDSTNAVLATTENVTRAAGASAAGVDVGRYQRIRTALSDLATQMSPLDQDMNVSQMPAPMVAEMQKGRDDALARLATELPAEVIDALRPRAATLRAQEKALVGERLKAAGIGR